MLRLYPLIAFGTDNAAVWAFAITSNEVAQWATALAGALGILGAGVAAAIPPLVKAWHSSWEQLNETQRGQFESTKVALESALVAAKKADESASKERNALHDEMVRRDDLHNSELAQRELRIREILNQNDEQLRRLDEQSELIVELTGRVGKMASSLDHFVCPNAAPGKACANAVCPKLPQTPEA